MGVSTNGIIGHGVIFEEDHEFPWNDDKFDGEDDWWRQVNNYQSPYDPFTEDNQFKDGWSADDPRFDHYYAHRYDWEKNNPIPFELINYCSEECPMYGLMVPETCFMVLRGNPSPFDPEELVVDFEKLRDFIEFLKKWNLYQSDPRWWLMSYWG